jgi:hypothetical protein
MKMSAEAYGSACGRTGEKIMDRRNSMMFRQGDSTTLPKFLMVPVALFTDDRYRSLTNNARIAYALYMRRFQITSYSDEQGRYIIFTDREMSRYLDMHSDAMKTIRASLRNAGLISYARGVGVNRIYVHPYFTKEEEDIFYTERDIYASRFFRLSMDLFTEKFINLPMGSRVLYGMYFDMMCLSSANYYQDREGFLYFDISQEEQEKRFAMSAHTLVKYRRYLIACDLLGEYKPFGKMKRYYLFKLDSFEDRVFAYELMSEAEKERFLDGIKKDFRQRFIQKNDAEKNIETIKAFLSENGISRAEAARMYTEATGSPLSRPGMSKYLSGTRPMPKAVADFFMKLAEEGTVTHKCKNTTMGVTHLCRNTTMGVTHKCKNTTDKKVRDTFMQKYPEHLCSISPSMNAENHDTFLQKNTKHSGRDALNIIYTDKKENDNKETDNKAFQTHSSFNSKKKNCPQKEKEQERAGINVTHSPSSMQKAMNKVLHFMKEHYETIVSDDIELMGDLLKAGTSAKSFTIDDNGESVSLSSDEMAAVIDEVFTADRHSENHMMKILNDLRHSGAMSDYRRASAYFTKSFMNLMFNLKHHRVFVEQSTLSLAEKWRYVSDRKKGSGRHADFPESVKNLAWWDTDMETGNNA